tara:strand:+ start:812 stop:1258 length:447 start_codon:yes stop_codon:yes gene_type:complete
MNTFNNSIEINPISKFNIAIRDFIQDLKKFDIVSRDVSKLETYIEITKVNSKALIRQYQSYLLRDSFVKNVLKNNIDFFLEFDISEESESKNIRDLVTKLQNIISEAHFAKTLDNTDTVFHWLKVLSFYAYQDIGINPSEKFKSLVLN